MNFLYYCKINSQHKTHNSVLSFQPQILQNSLRFDSTFHHYILRRTPLTYLSFVQYYFDAPVGGPVGTGSTTISCIVRLTAGFLLSGSVALTILNMTTKNVIPPSHMAKPSPDEICWQSKSRASSGATPSSKIESDCSDSCPTKR